MKAKENGSRRRKRIRQTDDDPIITV